MIQHTAIGNLTAGIKRSTLPFAIFIFFSIRLSATYAPYYPRFYRGFPILKNKDSLFGQIMIPQLGYTLCNYREHDEVVFRSIDSATHATREIRISRSDIAFVRLFYKLVYIGGIAYSEHYSFIVVSWKTKSDSITERHTDYINISWCGNNYLVRLLASGKADVCDFYQNPEIEITDPAVSRYLIPIYKRSWIKFLCWS
jgi:hypothetical protein